MKIRVAFTIRTGRDDRSMENLLALAGGVTTDQEIRDFIRGDAEDYVVQYLTDNGVRCEIVRPRSEVGTSDDTGGASP